VASLKGPQTAFASLTWSNAAKQTATLVFWFLYGLISRVFAFLRVHHMDRLAEDAEIRVLRLARPWRGWSPGRYPLPGK
jgi:hypothetical protein